MERNHISRIEAGRYSVGFDTLHAIADALDADIRILPREWPSNQTTIIKKIKEL